MARGEETRGNKKRREEQNVQTVATPCHQGSCCYGDMHCHDEPTMPGEAPARQHLFHDISFQRQQREQNKNDKEREIVRKETQNHRK